MNVSLIVAASTNNVIGKNNALPWHLPVDLKFFKNTTWGMPVVMGRKTFEAMGNKVLPGRTNIIVTRQGNWKAEGVVVANSLSDALFVAKQGDYKEVFVIGGGQIFEETMNKADKIYMTRVQATIEGDTFFPVIKEDKWRLISSRDVAADEKHAYDFSFQLWERK
ncbi:MAG: dihydrofolate reductase [Segetibacter sp.]|nr:dihydrofolate reductase [Segetibacter sp.]